MATLNQNAMLVPFGTRTIRIKRYTDSAQYCPACHHHDLRVAVYKPYFHIFFIPMVPAGATTSRMYCGQCGQPQRIDSLQRQYEQRPRTPFYLYTGTILFFAPLGLAVFLNLQTQKQKALYVAQPQVGDVYLVGQELKGFTAYYFFRVSSVKGDTVRVYHNNILYNGFVTELNPEDYFVTSEELVYTKSALEEMLDKDQITSVERDYDDTGGFNRVR